MELNHELKFLRYFSTLKSYVRNRAHPKGSIVEAYHVEECSIFCSQYLEGVETRTNQSTRVHYDDTPDTSTKECIFPSVGRPYGSIEGF